MVEGSCSSYHMAIGTDMSVQIEECVVLRAKILEPLRKNTSNTKTCNPLRLLIVIQMNELEEGEIPGASFVASDIAIRGDSNTLRIVAINRLERDTCKLYQSGCWQYNETT